MERIQTSKICEDLHKKIVLLAGPRQAGKTWIAKYIVNQFPHSLYLNYDSLPQRNLIQKQSWLPEIELVVLDELHKMPNWKNYLKGLYDTKPEHLKILVTGSARLELFQQVGDSLAGRYFLHHLLPLSLAELNQLHQPVELEKLLVRGGFPEPYLAGENVDAERWRMQYIDSLLRIDVLEFENLNNLRAIQLVFEILRHRVGSPVSYQSIAEDVAISPNTVKKYIQILEALYIIFLVRPYSKNIARSLLKEPKIYFFDTGLVEGHEGIRFENLVAVSLLKHVYGKRDYLAQAYSLNYLRTKEHREVDFALVKDKQVEMLIEVKLSNSELSDHLYYFHQKYKFSAYQIFKNRGYEQVIKGVFLRNALNFLKDLYL